MIYRDLTANDVTGLYAESPGGEGMAQFVQHHAAEQGEYEDHALHDRCRFCSERQ